jgi:hypothetical protein
VDPIPDALLLRKYGSARNQPGPLGMTVLAKASRNLTNQPTGVRIYKWLAVKILNASLQYQMVDSDDHLRLGGNSSEELRDNRYSARM